MLNDSDTLLVHRLYVFCFNPHIRLILIELDTLLVRRTNVLCFRSCFVWCWPCLVLPVYSCKCFLFQCFRHRTLIFFGCFTTDCTYFVVMLTTSSDADRIGCFAHSFRSQTVRALFLSSSSGAYRVGCFAHLQQVTDLPRISLYLMLVMSCILPAYRLYVICFDTLFIRYWLSRAPCSFAGCMCFIFNFVLFDKDWHLSTDCMCFDSMLLSFYAN